MNWKSRRSAKSTDPENEGMNEISHGLSTMAMPSTHIHKLIIGVDFGTTFTGVSWALSTGAQDKTLGDIKVVQSWPGSGRNAQYQWKTPSRIAYVSQNPSLDKNAWGFDVLPKLEAVTWMKLLLDSEQSSKYDDPSLVASEGSGVLRLPPGKTAVDVCADYLTGVAAFAYKELSREFGEEVVAISPLEFWFTVPAVWSDRAKQDTLHAAEVAAKNAKVFSTLEASTYLIPEPEAAAVAAISDITQGGSALQVEPGDGILVCDCGGGTVDVTTYQVTSIAPKLQFKEHLVGTGGKCGSTYIDRLFINWMEERFGAAYTRLAWAKRGPSSTFMNNFEGIKQDFGSTTSKSYEMHLVMQGVSDSDHYDTSEWNVKISEAQVKEFFDPIVSKIVELVESQLEDERKLFQKRSIKTVILVGGFGDSKYLYDTLRTQCDAWSIRLICPKNPQAAIVRGAVLSGLYDLQPLSRRARRHYGFSWSLIFDKKQHREEHRYLDKFDNEYRASGYMKWCLGKGDDVTENTHIRHSVFYTVEDLKPNMKFAFSVYQCDLDVPPRHYSDHGVRKLANCDLDLTSFDLSSCKRKKIRGKHHVRIEYEIQIYFGSKKGVLDFLGVYNGAEVGRLSVKFDGQGSEGVNGVHGNGEKAIESCGVM